MAPSAAGLSKGPHDKILRSIKLLGREVAPAVRDEIARRGAKAV